MEELFTNSFLLSMISLVQNVKLHGGCMVCVTTTKLVSIYDPILPSFLSGSETKVFRITEHSLNSIHELSK